MPVTGDKPVGTEKVGFFRTILRKIRSYCSGPDRDERVMRSIVEEMALDERRIREEMKAMSDLARETILAVQNNRLALEGPEPEPEPKPKPKPKARVRLFVPPKPGLGERTVDG